MLRVTHTENHTPILPANNAAPKRRSLIELGLLAMLTNLFGRRERPLLVLVGTYGEKLPHVHGKGEGVYALLLDRRQLTPLGGRFHGVGQLRAARNPSWVTSWRDGTTGQLYCYVADERTDTGLIFAAHVNETTGELTQLGAPVSAGGSGTCHIAVAPGGRHVLAANYGSGSVAVVERDASGALGKRAALIQLPPKGVEVDTPIGKCELYIRFPRTHAARQEAPHAHQLVFSRRRPTELTAVGEEAYAVLVPDLGSDIVWAFDYEPSTSGVLLPAAATAIHAGVLDGGGSRHVALHPDPRLRVAYVAYELTSQVAAYAVDPSSGQPTGTPLPPGPVCALDVGASAATPAGLSSAFGPAAAAARLRCVGLVRRGGGGAARCSDDETSLAAIRVTASGSHVILSSRVAGADGVLSALLLDKRGRLVASSDARPAGLASSLGRSPRDFVLVPLPGAPSGQVALVANQDSGTIVALPLAGGGQARCVADVPTPVCLCLTPEDAEPAHGAAAAGGGRAPLFFASAVVVVAVATAAALALRAYRK